MPHIAPHSLLTLEAYARQRGDFRARVIEHKKRRTVCLGEHLMLIFEDELTVRYQVQEMLRIERIFEEDGIRGELDAYNPLIPDGGNFKATMMLEYPAVEERRVMLEAQGDRGPRRVKAEGCKPVYAIADEDLDRENDDKTSAVHFLRFELDAESRASLKHGASLAVGVDHACFTHAIQAVDAPVREALVADLA